jgi:hypothetical protein
MSLGRANLLRMTRRMNDAQIREAIRQHAASSGRKGGKARAKNMSAAKRSESARKAARARWRKT